MRNRRLVEHKTAPFDPAYFSKKEACRHRVIPFELVDGELELPKRPIEIRPGPLPYRPPGAGNTVVVYKDAAGRELDRYAMEDPTRRRSCDFDRLQHKDKKRATPVGKIEPRTTGKVPILVPDGARVVQIELLRRPLRFDLRDKIKEGVKPIK